jgi:hypothetical protein
LVVYPEKTISLVVYPAKTAPLKKGTLIADGTEQTLLEFVGVGVVSGHIDLQNMEEGDVVIIRQYIKVKEDGEYKKYAEETYTGIQELPVIYITPKAVDIAMKITLQQTSGTYKSFDYNFIREY